MTTGTIKKVVADRGFGFITAEDAKEYFFHRNCARLLARLRPPQRRREGRVRDRAEPQGPARDPGAVRLATAAARPIGPLPTRTGVAVLERSPAPLSLSPDPPRLVRGIPDRRTPWRGSPERSYLIVRTAFVSTYPPRRCGIATFTHDLAAATGGREVVALHPPEQERRTRSKSTIASDATCVPTTCRPRAPSIGCVDVVSIQHEYGIWGGEDGEYVLDFVRSLRIPAVATLHTVLRDPTTAPARRPDRTGRPHGGHGRHVAIGGGPADERVRRRCPSPRHHPARRAGPPARRSRVDQGRIGTRGPRRDPQLRPAGPGQGLRPRPRSPSRGRRGTPDRLLRHRGGHPPRSPSDRGRSLSRPARRPDRSAWGWATTSGSSIASWAGWS